MPHIKSPLLMVTKTIQISSPQVWHYNHTLSPKSQVGYYHPALPKTSNQSSMFSATKETKKIEVINIEVIKIEVIKIEVIKIEIIKIEVIKIYVIKIEVIKTEVLSSSKLKF